ncbi:MAG: cytochrome c3 family protein [Campylobacteraceae bacterium]
MKKILLIILITFIGSVIVIYSGEKVVKVTGDAPFCGSCHKWDGLIAEAAIADNVHGSANPKGVKASCTSCHLPHDNIAKYLAVKAKNGIAEGWTTLTGNPEEKDWIANRDNARKNYTYDSSCLSCHENILTLAKDDTELALGSSKMHLKYEEFKNTKDKMMCTSCHKHVGHKDLGKVLFDQKDNRPKTWEEWDTQRAKLSASK